MKLMRNSTLFGCASFFCRKKLPLLILRSRQYQILFCEGVRGGFFIELLVCKTFDSLFATLNNHEQPAQITFRAFRPHAKPGLHAPGAPKSHFFSFFQFWDVFFADRKIIKNRTPPKRDRKVVTIDIRRPPGRPKPPLLKKTLISSLILEAIFHEKSMQKSMLNSKPQKS